jgi:SpoIID/LytB domain protein
MSMKSALSLALSAALFATVAGSARAGEGRRPAGRFTFHGSGNGHGLGLSQYGALGLARDGWTGEQIVRHYYTGVKVLTRDPPEPTIRVGLLQDAASVRLHADHGAFDLLLQNGQNVDTVPDGARRTIEVTQDKRYRVLRPDGSEVATVGSASNHLVARRQGEARIRVSEWGHVLGRGELRFEISAPGKAHLLAVLQVEEYAFGVSEVPSAWPRAALEAQAIAVRTYSYWRLAGAPRAGCACDLYATTADQVYAGWDKEAASGGDRWVAAVNATARTVATYGGQPIYAAYTSSSGGHTEDIENVWPGSEPLPYLRGRCDPGDDVADNPYRSWSVAVDSAEITGDLKPYTGDIGTVRGFAGYRLGVSGRVSSVVVIGTEGRAPVDGWEVRTGLSLRDTRFSINRNLNISGAIRHAYDRMACRPGRAVTAQKAVRGGRWQGFAVGRLYQNGKRDRVTWLRGKVLTRYLDVGGPGSRLGLPYRYRNGKRGAKAWFDRGTIACAKRCRVRYR